MKKLSTEKLVNTILTLRKAKNMTQAQLSEATGINRAMIGRIENKDYTPTVEQLQALAEGPEHQVHHRRCVSRSQNWLSLQ